MPATQLRQAFYDFNSLIPLSILLRFVRRRCWRRRGCRCSGRGRGVGVDLANTFLEFTYTLTEALHEFRNFACAEENKNNETYQQQFLHPEAHKYEYSVHSDGILLTTNVSKK